MPPHQRNPQQVPNMSVSPVIAFLDVDSFECQVWQRQYPKTRGKPCVVVNTSGRILACSYEAKALGVSRSTTPKIKDAQKLCPYLHVFHKPDKWGKQDQSKLRQATWEIVSHIQEFLKIANTGVGGDVILEVASSDEFYLDISAEVSRGMKLRAEKWAKKKKSSQKNGKGFKIPMGVVWEREVETKSGPFFYRRPYKTTKNSFGMDDIRAYSYQNEERLMFGALFLYNLCTYLEFKTGLEISGGVAKNKLLAKVGCGQNKPKKITIFFEEATHRVFQNVEISKIPGLGGTIGEQLAQNFSISKIGQIQKVPYKKLETEFGKYKAQQISSWAIGQDVDPVLQKIYKEQMKCNKPNGDIKGLPRLNMVLKNLTSEIKVLLEEEAVRSVRKAEEIKVEYKMKIGESDDNSNLESEVFEIKNTLDDLTKLPTKILSYFNSLPTFSEAEIHFTELAFTLKKFVPLIASESTLTYSFENLTLSSSGDFAIPSRLKIPNQISSSSIIPTFHHSKVGAFRMTCKLQYSNQHIDPPTLLKESELQSLVGHNMLRHFNLKTSCDRLIEDYTTYDEKKHKCFNKWLKVEKPKNKDLDDVQFIAFHGRIVRALKTPLNKTFGEWETFAMNVNNVIYLWDEKSGRTNNYFKPEGGYMGEYFEHLVTGREAKSGGVIEGMEKIFPVQKVTFGTHKLLLLSNVDAQDSAGDFVQVQLQTQENSMRGWKNNRESFMLERNLKIWSQAIISGSKTVVIGHKNGRNHITKINYLTTEEFSADVEDKQLSYNFVNRLLEWIHKQLPVHNEKLVKKFSWIPGRPSDCVCSTIPEEEVSKLVVPRIYFPQNQ